MPLVNPGAISNSSSRSFSNVFGRVSMDTYNTLKGSISSYDFYASMGKYPLNTGSKNNRKFKPKNIKEVILSTKLLK